METKRVLMEAVAAVEAKSKEKGFGVLHTYDVKATLASKGFDREPLKIIEICNQKICDRGIEQRYKDSPYASLSDTVYVQNGKTYISAFKAKGDSGFLS